MKIFRFFLLSAAIGSTLSIASCSKDDDGGKTNTNELTSKNLAINTLQEVPMPTGSSATGTMEVTYNKTTKMLSYNLTWAGLSDSITASHIHGTAPRGIAAPVKIPFTLPRGSLSGSYSGTTMVDGVLIKEDSLINGFYYVNIHTKKNPAGEIRGQITF